MNFFVFSRDAPGTALLRADQELLERHWAYMDRFAESMIARGPTLEADRETATGSVHILGLPSVDAAHAFVAHEPNNRAGLYSEHQLWRFQDLLGRTMWEYRGDHAEPLFLIISRAHPGLFPAVETLPARLQRRLIVYGALMTLDGAQAAGVALAVEAPERDAVRGLIEGGVMPLGAAAEVEIHDWEFGGRR